MGVMNKLRDNTGVILWILVFAFGIIWVLQDSGGLDVVGNLSNNIGTVNGDPITFEEYSRAIDAQVQSYQQRTGDSMPPQMLDQTRDRVFDQLVDTKLRQQEMERLGLDVADDELVEMIEGDNPHAIIKTYFGDGNGGVDRALLQNFIENPDARDDWLQIEDYLRNERLREKLDKLISGSVRVSPDEVEADYILKNRKADVRFVALRFTALSDDSISYSDSDLQRFYNDHKDEFARERSYSLSYVTSSKAPTPADTAAAFSELDLLREDFETTDNDSLFLVQNGSERPYSEAYFRPDELDDATSAIVFDNAEVGKVVGPVISGNQLHLLKILDVRPPTEPAIRASHILFRASEGDETARSSARKKALDIKRRLRNGEDFADLARQFSDDGSAAEGGDLKWFGRGRMVKPFEDAAFSARVGRVVGPVETQFGFHLIKVTDKATVEAKLADYALTLRASVETLNRVQEQLDDLQYFSSESGDFDSEAERRNLEIQTVTVEDGQSFIPGIGNSRALTNFLETASVSDVSPVIELNDQFLVATVTDITEAGFRPFDEVRAQIEPRLRNEMKGEYQRARLEKAATDDLDALAAAIASPVRTAEGLSYGNMVVPGIGRDPIFVGTALGMKEGETSGIVEGENAVFVLQVVKIDKPAALADAEQEQKLNQLQTQRQNVVRAQWITSLRDMAEIVDNRRQFLQ
jgi:peptidyl-prolyl cis-trans isomerase D